MSKRKLFYPVVGYLAMLAAFSGAIHGAFWGLGCRGGLREFVGIFCICFLVTASKFIDAMRKVE